MADILSRKSEMSRASQQSQKILDDVSEKSTSNLQGLLTDETISSVWGSFGLYISKQLRSGRSVKIPHFGVFTFSNPEVTLPGVTNPEVRDKQFREPVFIIQKDFLNGIPIQSGIFTDQGVRAINLQGLCGNIQMIQANQLEIADSANCSKENVRLALERIFRQISTQAKKDGVVQMVIPAIGTFYYKRGIASVNFYESLKKDCKGIVKRPLQEQIQKRQRYLTSDKLKQLEVSESLSLPKNIGYSTIDSSAIEWLGKNYDFRINDQLKTARAGERNKIGSLRSQSISNTNESHILLNGQQPLKKMQHWLLSNNLTPLQVFDEIAIKRAKHPNFISREEQGEVIKLNRDEFINYLVKIGCPIHIAELEFIFMKIDKQNNGYVNYNSFKEEITGRDDSIKQIQRSMKDLWINLKLNFQKKNLKDLLKEPGRKLQKEDLQQFFQVLEPGIRKEDFPLIISIILNGQSSIDQGKLASILSNTFDDLHSDLNWVQYTKKKISSQIHSKKELAAQILADFQQQDPKKIGEVDGNAFKQILKNHKIDLNSTDLNRLFKYESSNGLIDYNIFMKSLDVSTQFVPTFNSKDSDNLQKLAKSINAYIEQNALNYFTFIKHLFSKDGNNSEDTSKIRVSLFARLVFKYVNPDFKPHVIETLSQIIDIDKDGYIDKFDLETFIGRYKNFNLNLQQQPKNITLGGHEIDAKLLEGIDIESLPDALKSQKKEESNFGVHYDDEDDEQSENNTKNIRFNADPYPKAKLTDKQVDELNLMIRKALLDKKISNYDAFNMLDTNQDGFLILSEMNNLDRIIKLTQQQKEGYFAYMDNSNIGMVDYHRFLDVINKPNNFNLENKEDNWDWQLEILEKIRKWFISQNLPHEEAFKIADIDFDGQIGKKDLLSFLVDILHISPEFITETRIDRLFKLIDQHKRNSIQIGDFKKVLENKIVIGPVRTSISLQGNMNLSQTGSESRLSKIRYPSTSHAVSRKQNADEVISAQSVKFGNNHQLKSSYSSSIFQSSKLNQTINELNRGQQSFRGSIQNIFEWKVNAKHQIGLYVSKFYPDIRTSFDIVSGHQNRLLYSKFKQWVEEKRVLLGFNLTEKLLQQLFSDFDPHKKGYLSEHDWVSALKQYDSTELIIREIGEGIETQFKDVKQAFNAFSENNKDINFQQFCLQVFAQQPKRFKEEDLIKVWNRIAGSIGHTINFNDFKEQLYHNHNHVQNNIQNNEGSSLISPYASTQKLAHNSSSLSLISYANTQNSTMNVIEKMKKLVKSSDKVLENLFGEYDKSNSGFVTNLEFRNVMKRLNIGLSIQDIDSVLNICESKNGGTINWKEFCHKIRQTDLDNRLVSRAKARLEMIRKHIYYYLLSPKDAFRQFNENRSGKMTFDEFKTLIIQLGQLASSEMPSLPIIKDIFEFIDIRRDGVLDIHEWMETFRKLEVEQPSPQPTLIKRKPQIVSQSLQIPKVVDLSKGNSLGIDSRNNIFDAQIFGWECSQQFDLVLAVIGKNRKILLEKFKNEHKINNSLSYEKAKSIIGQVLEQSNIRLSEKNFACLVKFAEKNNEIDYRFMMEVFKSRQQQVQQYPIK